MKTALVTGASRGIGLATAKLLAPSVDRLIITSKHQETLDKTAVGRVGSLHNLGILGGGRIN